MSEYAYIERKLESLVRGRFDPIEGDGVYDTEACRNLNKLAAMLSETVSFSQLVASGDLSASPPPRSNYLASGIKSLHSQLLHVSWQARQVAKGDYSQKLDFMGEFSETFNWMAEQVAHREEEQRSYREMMLSVFDSLGSVIFLIDPGAQEIVYLNHAAEALLEARPGQAVQDVQNPLIGDIVDLQQPGFQPCEHYDNERRRWSTVYADAICWAEDKLLWLYHYVDVTQEKLERERLTRVAQTDALTGVYNRYGGTSLLDSIIATMRTGDSVCLCYMDMDGLKQVNDTYGHAEGDRLILRFVDGITKTLRDQDFVVRMGGDEFLAIFQLQTKSTVDHAMDRLIETFEQNNKDQDIPVLFSHGVIEFKRTDNLSAEEMIQMVDEEMYRHKRRRKAAMRQKELAENRKK